MMIFARDTVRGELYRRTKGMIGASYYEVPRISKEAYLKRLKAKGHRVTGREMYLIMRGDSNPDLVLLRLTRRSRDEGRLLKESSHLVLLEPSSKLRVVQSKPYPRGSLNKAHKRCFAP